MGSALLPKSQLGLFSSHVSNAWGTKLEVFSAGITLDGENGYAWSSSLIPFSVAESFY